MMNVYEVTEKDADFIKVLQIILKSIWKDYKLPLLGFTILAITAGILLTIAPKQLQKIIDLITTGRGWDVQFWKIILTYGGAVFFG